MFDILKEKVIFIVSANIKIFFVTLYFCIITFDITNVRPMIMFLVLLLLGSDRHIFTKQLCFLQIVKTVSTTVTAVVLVIN